MTKPKKTVTMVVDERELATILAALRFHQDENLQVGSDVPDQSIKEIASNCGSLKPLDFNEVGQLCERINTCKEPHATSPSLGLTITPPHEEKREKPLFRVVYVIDLNAYDVHAAAVEAYQIMSDTSSQSPVLQVIDHKGKTITVDLSEKQNHIQREHRHG